jgi:hypothetical protein
MTRPSSSSSSFSVLPDVEDDDEISDDEFQCSRRRGNRGLALSNLQKIENRTQMRIWFYESSGDARKLMTL